MLVCNPSTQDTETEREQAPTESEQNFVREKDKFNPWDSRSWRRECLPTNYPSTCTPWHTCAPADTHKPLLPTFFPPSFSFQIEAPQIPGLFSMLLLSTDTAPSDELSANFIPSWMCNEGNCNICSVSQFWDYRRWWMSRAWRTASTQVIVAVIPVIITILWTVLRMHALIESLHSGLRCANGRCCHYLTQKLKFTGIASVWFGFFFPPASYS